MAQPDRPVGRLLHRLEGAVDRRAAAGWIDAERARAALAAARQGLDGDETLGTATGDIARYTGLDSAETEVLLAAAASGVDPNLHLLSGLLSGDDGPARPTVALLMELAGLNPLRAETRARFAELGPLRRHRLIHLPGDGVLLARRAHVPETVIAHLLGDMTPPAALMPLLGEARPVSLPGTEVVAAAIRNEHLLVWVHCPPGAAGAALAAAACRELDVTCVVGDLRRLPGEPTATALTAALDDLLLEATLTGSVLIVSGADLVMPYTGRLAHPALPVIAIGARPWDPAWTPERLPISVVAPRLPVTVRTALWRPMMGDVEIDPQVAALRLTPEEIARVARLARDSRAANSGESPDSITVAAVRAATRRLGRNRSSKFAAITEPATLDDLVLPEHTKSEVQRLLNWARYRDEVLAQGPLQGKGGKGTGICALFAGSPGTGKSLAAHVVADTLGMDLYSVDVSSMVDKYVGETEKNLERVFTEAESLNSVLFFDEADSLFGSRSEVRDAHDRYANQEVAYLLQRMEQFDGITILATNLRGNLDPAFSRRLHFVIHFPDPDEVTKRHLWDYHLSHLSGTDPQDPVDVMALAKTLDLAGGDIRNIVLSAAYHAAAEQCPVGMRHIVAAANREFIKLGRRVPAVSS